MDKAATLMEENYDFLTDEEVKKELDSLQAKLQNILEKDFDIVEVNEYWSYTDLETIARKALMNKPQKYGLTDDALRELIIKILASGELETESTMDYWFEFLDVETGIEDAADCLFCENDKGDIEFAPIDTIMKQLAIAKKEQPEPNVILL